MKSYKHILSLGKDCQVANYLSRRWLVTWGDVFDNMVTYDLDGVIRFIEHNLSSFFDKSHIVNKGPNQFGKSTVVDQFYSIVSVHDFSIHEFDQSYHNFLTKKAAKLRALRLIIEEEEPLLFVRKNVATEPIENTVRLFDTLKSIRGELEFDLIVFQKHGFFERSCWGIDNLHTYYDEEWTWDGDWKGNFPLWDDIFRQVSVQKTIWGRKGNIPLL